MVTSDELGPLEMRVLGMLRADQPASVAVLRRRLADEGSDLAYTTVMTVLSRLHGKGLAVRVRDGNRYLYSPATKVPAIANGVFGRMRRALFAEDKTRPILNLLEEEELSKAELQALRRVIDRKLRDAKGPKSS